MEKATKSIMQATGKGNTKPRRPALCFNKLKLPFAELQTSGLTDPRQHYWNINDLRYIQKKKRTASKKTTPDGKVLTLCKSNCKLQSKL